MAATIQRLKAQPRNLLAIGILITIVTFGLTSGHFPLSPAADADSSRMVSLYADGSKHIFATDATTVGEVLSRSGIVLHAGDLVEPSADTAVPTGFFNINVYRARPVLVVDGDKSYRVMSAYQSPHLLAEAAGVKTFAEDAYATTPITNIVDNDAIGEKVTVQRAMTFTLHADGKDRLLRTQPATVAAALKTENVPLGAKDVVSVPLDSPVNPGMTVAISRVADANITVSDVIPRTTQTVNDPTILKGQTTIRSDGADGNKTAIYHVHYQDGVETARTLVQLVSQTEPQPRVLAVGTKVLFAGSVEYWRPQVQTAAAQWGLDPNMMMRIMACESGGNATSISHFVVNGQHPEGLFQYLPTTWAAAGGSDSNILDGPTQIALTARKMATDGTGAWQCK